MGEIIDKVKGNFKKAKGAVIGDQRLVQEGQLDEAKGSVKGAMENVKHAIKDVAKRRAP